MNVDIYIITRGRFFAFWCFVFILLLFFSLLSFNKPKHEPIGSWHEI